jgi:hypothetical protein
MADEVIVSNVPAETSPSLGVTITPEDFAKVGFTSMDMKMVNDLGGKTDAFGAPIIPDNPQPESGTAVPTVDSDIQKFVAEALGQTPPVTPESVAKEGDKVEVKVEPAKADVIGKVPYTVEEMRALDVDHVDTSRIPPELLPFYKAMNAPVTRKSQEYSDRIRQLELRETAINAKLEERRELELQQRRAQDESQLTPEELADKRKQQEFDSLRNEVLSIRAEREQQRLTQAIENEYSANAKELGIPDEIKDDALTLVWKQWQLDKANGNVDRDGRPLSKMRDILEQGKSKLDRLAGNSISSKLDLNTLKGLIKANPEAGKAYVMEIINQYVQSKKSGATVITANPSTPIPSQPQGEKKITSWQDWQEERDKALSQYMR